MKPDEITWADPTAIPRTWWVLFQDFPGCWYLSWLRPGWRHCFALADMPGLGSVMLNPVRGGLWVDYDQRSPAELAPLFGASRVVRIEVAFSGAQTLRGMYSCVSTIKAALGITRSWAVTPRQLYQELLARGGEDVTPAATEVMPWLGQES